MLLRSILVGLTTVPLTTWAIAVLNGFSPTIAVLRLGIRKLLRKTRTPMLFAGERCIISGLIRSRHRSDSTASRRFLQDWIAVTVADRRSLPFRRDTDPYCNCNANPNSYCDGDRHCYGHANGDSHSNRHSDPYTKTDSYPKSRSIAKGPSNSAAAPLDSSLAPGSKQRPPELILCFEPKHVREITTKSHAP